MPELAPALSRIQFETLLALADGEKGPETLARLGISRTTLNQRYRVLRDALGARTNAHAVALAYHEGILVPRRRQER